MKYSIEGTPLPVVICQLEAGEGVRCEAGGMSWMSDNMEMETKMHGGLGKAFGRAFTGESMFLPLYTSVGGPGMIAFASSFPGTILPVQVTPGNGMICQKRAFLAAQTTVELSVHVNKKVGAGFFGGEGFLMQKIGGSGLAFLELDGHMVEYTLEPGQSMIVDTGTLAAMSESVTMDIRSVGGVKNALFGGEGLFNTRVTGPGKIWLQTMPANKLAAALGPMFTSK